MAKKRQKKLERKRKKRNEKRQELHRHRSLSLAAQMQRAATAPIYECLMTTGLDDKGIGQVIFSRKMADRQIAAAFFLLDTYCLGTKDSYGRLLTQAEFEEAKQLVADSDNDLLAIDAASARRLVEQAVVYAREIGFAPGGDYRKLTPLFGDIDPADGADLCVFGYKGKPLFVSGPHDSTDRCRRVINTLMTTCGPDGFDYYAKVEESDIPEGARITAFEDDGGLHFLENDDEYE